MKKKMIAVITGASSGMGKVFAETVDQFGVSLDEVWVIARREERLKEIKCPYPICPLSLDLSDRNKLKFYEHMLKQENVRVALLVNASGFGRFEATMDSDLAVNMNMVDLNCQALQAMCQLTVPYMKKGSRIINIASVAAFQPIPYINVYAATKAFVLSYSRGLNRELKSKGIRVMALCPFWTKTEFFNRAIDEKKNQVVKKYTAMYDPQAIVSRAWHDLKRRKDVSTYGFVARFQALLCKILPHRFVMWYWMQQQKLQ